MHEESLVANLLRSVETVAREHDAGRVVSVRVSLGALSGMSPERLRAHFLRTAADTVAEGARLDVSLTQDGPGGAVSGLRLESVEIEG